MSVTAPPGGDPTAGGLMPQGGAGGGQGVQILQQIQDLLAQLSQVESDPGVQRAVQSIQGVIDPLMQAVGGADQQDMTSGLANPGGDASGGMPPGGPAEDALDGGADDASEGPPPKGFGGAKKAAMANFGKKGHFSKSGSKGEQLQTDKTKNRLKGGK